MRGHRCFFVGWIFCKEIETGYIKLFVIGDGRPLSSEGGKSGHHRAGSPFEKTEGADDIPCLGKCHRKQTAGRTAGKGEMAG